MGWLQETEVTMGALTDIFQMSPVLAYYIFDRADGREGLMDNLQALSQRCMALSPRQEAGEVLPWSWLA